MASADRQRAIELSKIKFSPSGENITYTSSLDFLFLFLKKTEGYS